VSRGEPDLKPPPNDKVALPRERRRPRGRPNAEQLVELEKRLIRVARQAFIAHGYGATSMNQVARAARLSKTTLYTRFPSKADLFRAIVDEQARRVGGVGQRPIYRPSSMTLEAKLRDYIEHMTRISLRGEILQINRLIFSEATRFPELGEAASRRAWVGVRQVAALIEEYSVKDGIPCSDPAGAAEVYIMMHKGWYYSRMLTDRPVSNAEMTEAIEKILKHFLAGRSSW
jgi:TetR/AcrR family transcriptional regulator, mexJK operon transcriptional repressor